MIRTAVLLALVSSQAYAISVDTGNPDLKIRWDNTFGYSAGFRLQDQDSKLINDNTAVNQNNINLDDGDRNFDKGLISNRLDLLTEFDMSYKGNFGLRLSGAAWYDDVYNGENDNDAPFRVNHSDKAYNEFTDDTVDLHGKNAELLDGFIYAKSERANARLGRHSVLYGETLFFGSNGIANAQSPVDVVKLLSVPNSQFKEVILPVNQLSAQYQVRNNVTVGGYYQFEWRATKIPGVGSYFSIADVLGEGGEEFLFASKDLPVPAATRLDDMDASDNGQFGGQVRWRPEGTDLEVGFYAARYHDKVPQVYLRPMPLFGLTTAPLNFQQAYAEDIKTYGVSVSTVLGDLNVAAEASVRRNTPLVSGPVVDTSADGSADNDKNVGYAVGNSAHVNLSAIAFLNGSAVWDNATFTGELGWNRRTSVTKNAAEIDPNTSRDAWGMRFIFEPSWYQALPSLDLAMPIGLGYNPKGNSSVVQQFNGGVDDGGDLSIGLKGVYKYVWKMGVNYTHFIGDVQGALGDDANLTFGQSLADRDFISVSLQRAF